MDKDIEQLSFEQGDGERINRIWYYIPNEAELQKIQTDLKPFTKVSKQVAYKCRILVVNFLATKGGR